MARCTTVSCKWCRRRSFGALHGAPRRAANGLDRLVPGFLFQVPRSRWRHDTDARLFKEKMAYRLQRPPRTSGTRNRNAEPARLEHFEKRYKRLIPGPRSHFREGITGNRMCDARSAS
jgi:hypothetical protein